jgi:hypothetical protein
MDGDLGYLDDETCWLEPIENPFSPKVFAMPSLGAWFTRRILGSCRRVSVQKPLDFF